MRLVLDITQRGNYFRTISNTPFAENIVEMTANPAQYAADKKKIAESLVAMAMGLHGNPTELFQTFGLTFAEKSDTVEARK